MTKLISIGQIIDTTWDVYTKNFKPLMKISLWGFLVGAFVILRLILLPDGETETIATIVGGNPEQATIIAFALAVGISIFAIPITSIWIYMNLVRGADAHLGNKKYTFSDLSRRSWGDFFVYLWVMILKSVASILPVLLIVPGVLLLIGALFWDSLIFNSLGFLLTFLGTLAAFVLIVWLSVRLAFAGYAMLLDGKSGVSALKESFGMSDGRFWATLWRILIPKIVFGAGVVIVEVIVSVLLSLIVGSLHNLGPTFGLYAGLIVTVALTTGIRVLYPPLFIIADQLIYGSLKANR